MVWPLTSWGEGSSPDNPAFPTWAEYEAVSRSNPPAGSHVSIRGNCLTGYYAAPSETE